MSPGRRARLTDDAGTSLLLVMGLLLITGLVVVATLSYASTSITASAGIAGSVDTSYDVDGALQAGINQLRNSDVTARPEPGGGEPDCATLVVPGPEPGRDVAVTCEALPGSGSLAEAIGRSLPQALLATGLGAPRGEDGITVEPGGHLGVVGDVASNTNVAATEASLDARGAVTAVTGCTGSVQGTTRDCTADPVEIPEVRQPSAGFEAREVPRCPGDGSTIRFEPGYYSDATALSDLMDSCSASTFWFPGATSAAAYYFDFHNGEPGQAAGSHTWKIADPRVRVVAGGSTPPGKPATVQIPGSCPSPLDTTANHGVTFVFGGDSRLQVTAGQVELCGPGDAPRGAPPVAIFGADRELGDSDPAATGPETAPTGDIDDSEGMLKAAAESVVAAPPGAPSIADFSSAEKPSKKEPAPTTTELVRDWDDSSARATIDGSQVRGGQQAIVRLRGFEPSQASPAATIPAGATLTYAHLYVRHREARIKSGKDPVAFIQASVTPSRPGAPAVGPTSPPGGFTPGVGVNPDKRRTKYRVDTVDLLATSALQDEVSEHGFSGATVQWLVQSKDSLDLTADLDTIQIAMGWIPGPQLRAQTTLIDGRNCVAAPTAGYPGSGACALVSTSGADDTTRFHVQGSGYAPRAAFDFGHRSIRAPVFAAGLVGRQLTFGVTSAARPAYRGPAVSLPEPLTVLLRAHTCSDSPCPRPAGTTDLADPWHLAGTATVRYRDPGSHLVAGGRQVSVLTWSTYP